MDARNPNTQAVAEFITETRYRDLPADVDRATRRAVLDSIGCAIGGTATPLHVASVKALVAHGSGGDATTVGGRLQAAPAWVALANAIAINALDFDDTYEDGTNPISHPGSSTMGALLALASGKRLRFGVFLANAAVGYEVAIRVARAMQPSQQQRDAVWGLGPHQVFGSAAVSARMLGLEVSQTIEALGLAGVHTSVPSVWTASGWLKDAVGWPAMTGVMSAYLAAAGFAGPARIFDGRRSYYRTVASDTYRPDLLVEQLGGEWNLLRLSLKPYPTCRWIHPVLDALAEMRDAEHLTAGEVERIEIDGFWELEKLFLRYRPSDLIDAQFSLPYACARVLAGTPAGPDWFKEAALSDASTLALADRVVVRTDADVELLRKQDPSALKARVTLILTDGRVLLDERSVAHGHPNDPLSDEEVAAKFIVLAEPIVGSAAEAIARFVLEADPDAETGNVLEAIVRPDSASAVGALDG